LILNELNRWKGSIYKILWRPVLVYFVTYITLGLIYKFQLTEENKLYLNDLKFLKLKFKKKTNGLKCYLCRVFESIALCCAKYADSIPVVLFLGFFTATGKFCLFVIIYVRAPCGLQSQLTIKETLYIRVHLLPPQLSRALASFLQLLYTRLWPFDRLYSNATLLGSLRSDTGHWKDYYSRHLLP